jgi:hypothetical protein
MAASQPDPFSVVHSDIYDLIIQHFKVNDIKQLTTVSKDWNRIIGGSSAALKRIMLNVDDFLSTKPTRSKFTALLNSNRKYQNLSILLDSGANLKRKLMVLLKFSSTLVYLHVHGDSDGMEKNLPAILSFPKLEILTTLSISVSFAKNILKDADGLKILSIHLRNPNDVDEEFFEILKNKKALKKLGLDVLRDFPSFGSSQKQKFKLTSLYISNLADVNSNFKAFVLSMADTLTTLDVCFSHPDDALLIQKLPALKTLKIFEHCEDGLLESYEPNTSIEILELKQVNTAPPEFLESFKSVRSMRVWWIDKNEFKKILKSCPGLLKLEVRNGCDMEQKDIEDIYKEVRSVEPSSVESLEVEIRRKMSFVLKL